MHISVGTLNKAKLSACNEILTMAFGQVELHAHEVDSGVSAMPMTNEETAKGALNRAHAALALYDNATYGIGLEGGVYEGPGDRMFLLGWVAIVDTNGMVGLGHSGGVVLPKDIATAIRLGGELGPIMQERMQDKNNDIRHSLGTTGLLTKGLYPRNREFEDALRNALAPFVAPEFYLANSNIDTH